MILSKTTIEVLNIFKDVSTSLFFNENKSGMCATASDESSGHDKVLIYSLPEEETKITPFSIYSLEEFLKLYNKMSSEKGFVCEFLDNHILLKTSRSQLKFYHCSEALLPERPKKKISNLPDPVLNFVLKKEDLNDLKEMASVMKIEILIFSIQKNQVIGILKDANNPTTNIYKLHLGENALKNDFEGSFGIRIGSKKTDFSLLPTDHLIEANDSVLVRFSALKEIETANGKKKEPIGFDYFISKLDI